MEMAKVLFFGAICKKRGVVWTGVVSVLASYNRRPEDLPMVCFGCGPGRAVFPAASNNPAEKRGSGRDEEGSYELYVMNFNFSS
ncbi:MAG: hypothetical protein NTX75_13995 [Proteobacteria bacterium]|nr:hypothetical protein [Pseudomonadota bacterium]